jgi:hypothetical protein
MDQDQKIEKSILHEELCIKLTRLRFKYDIPDIYTLMSMETDELKSLYDKLIEKDERERIYTELDNMRLTNQNIKSIENLESMDFNSLKAEHEKYKINNTLKTIINNINFEYLAVSIDNAPDTRTEFKLSNDVKQNLTDYIDESGMAESFIDIKNSLVDIVGIIVKKDSFLW